MSADGTTDTTTPAPETDHYVATRTVQASPSQVFALLADPSRHPETEPTDWVRASLEEHPAPLTEVGQVFGIEMHHVNAGGRYDMHNRVIAFAQDRTLAWEPGQYGPDGELGTGGWTWRYDLAPADDPGTAADGGARSADGSGAGADGGAGSADGSSGSAGATVVTLTYSWEAVPPAQRELFQLPPFPPSFLDESLASLDRALTGEAGA